jgi:peptidoglycan/xylan/chitin deacetylase (PgdA/CDA1 family)
MKTKFIFTIDVETRTLGCPDQDIMGILPGHKEHFGIARMMDILDYFQARATFFLNVYEMSRYGEDSTAEVARLIHLRGHDLQLHTHPRPMYPFYGMSKAPYSDQVAILQKGISLIERWTGKRVIAHRAGAFSANGDTLRAVAATGLKADCSLSPGSHVVVPLVQELGATNVVQQIGKVAEIPMTCYDQLRFGSWHARRILDIEGSSLSEIKSVCRMALQHRLPTITILAHSFSFTRFGRPNKFVMRKMAKLLEWLGTQDRFEIATVEEACAWLNVHSMAAPKIKEEIPHTGPRLAWFRAIQSWRDGWKNFIVAAASLVACVAIAAFELGHVVRAFLHM